MTRWLLLVAVVAACKGGAKQGGEGAPMVAGSATSAGSAPVAGSATPVASDAALVQERDASLDDPRSQAARCASGCLYLMDLPLAAARDAFTRDCSAAWPYANDDCDGLLYARNCIYAGHGNVFKRPEWKQRFETQPWYRAKPTFKERDFSPVALANVRALVAASKVCDSLPPRFDDEEGPLQLHESELGAAALRHPFPGKGVDPKAILAIVYPRTTIYRSAPDGDDVRVLEQFRIMKRTFASRTPAGLVDMPAMVALGCINAYDRSEESTPTVECVPELSVLIEKAGVWTIVSRTELADHKISSEAAGGNSWSLDLDDEHVKVDQAMLALVELSSGHKTGDHESETRGRTTYYWLEAGKPRAVLDLETSAEIRGSGRMEVSQKAEQDPDGKVTKGIPDLVVREDTTETRDGSDTSTAWIYPYQWDGKQYVRGKGGSL